MEFAPRALVTGGSSGIGKGIALVLAEQGYDVAVTYGDNAEGGLETVEEIRALGRRGFCYQADLSTSDAPERVVRQAIADLGHLTLLVNNAGRTIHHSVMFTSAQEMDYIYGLNYRAYLLCTGAAARHMAKRGIKGCILFITSTHGERAYANDVMYGSLKAGINRACQSIALDLAPYGIRANCIAPGATNVRDWNERSAFAEAIPLQRFGTPRENGELAAFLASDKCTYITGATIRVDGGLILPGMIEGSRLQPELVHAQTAPDWLQKVRKMVDDLPEEE